MFHISGLDAAGKTTLLYRIKLGEVIDAAPSIGKVAALNDYPPRKHIIVLFYDVIRVILEIYSHILQNINAILMLISQSSPCFHKVQHVYLSFPSPCTHFAYGN